MLDKIGLKAQDTSELFFDDVQVPAESLLGGQEGQGFYQLMGDLPYERLIIGVIAVGRDGRRLRGHAGLRARAPGLRQADRRASRTHASSSPRSPPQIKVGRAFVDRCVDDLVAGKLDTVTASMAKLWAHASCRAA